MNISRRIISAAATAVLGTSLLFTGYSLGQAAPAAPVPVAQATPVKTLTGDQVCTTAPIYQAIYGDSITSFNPPYAGDINRSWAIWASSNAYPASYGWAYPGANLAQMAAHATNSPAKVVTIMGGTNDLAINAPGVVKAGTPKAQMLASIDQIVAIEQPEEVVILAVPPFGWNYYESTTWNAELAAHAAAKGYNFFDPWTGYRDANGAWWPGLSNDAVHPNPAYVSIAGKAIYANLLGL